MRTGTFSYTSSKASLKQQAPEFAKEVRKRAAIQRAASEPAFSEGTPEGSQTDSIARSSNEDTDSMRDESRIEKFEESYAAATDDDSPFDRSYFRYDHEEADGGPSHEGHVGGRALDAIIVR
jgi:hypothetical protein